MRLHRLAVTAFGPFAGTEHVDFDALAAAGLFLLHGPTGAGKTSILDAVCFALYGQVPGRRAGASRSAAQRPRRRRRRARGRARGDAARAAAADHPVARLGATQAARRGHRHRAGARAAARSSTGGEWTTLSTRLDEAGQQIGELLGLTLQQFCQVVLLPQGEFAEFLRADADGRRALLESALRHPPVLRRRASGWSTRRKETARELGDLDDG